MIDWRKAIVVFLASLGLTSLFINSENANYFLLQNAMIASLVEHGTFSLKDQVIPGFNLVEGDETFRFNNQVYPMKQPGQTVVGATIYSLLERVGIDFIKHYDYASNIITFMTSSFAVAISSVILFVMSGSIIPSVILLFATIVWPYSGLSHHDIYALPFLTGGWYFAVKKRYFLAFFLLGLSLFFSMLPLTFPISLLIYMLVKQENFKDILRSALGLVIASFPVLAFNYLVFGNPFLFPNLAGQVQDTMPFWNLANFWLHINFFINSPLTSIFAFSPVLLFGFWAVRHKDKKDVLILSFIITLLFLLHIFSQETIGGYQYGPRYLIPLLPIWSYMAYLGLVTVKIRGKIVFFLLLSYSIITNLIGAMKHVMYPVPSDSFAPITLGKEILGGQLPEYRILPISILILVFTFLYCCLKHINPIGSLHRVVLRKFGR